jgi:type II secretory pathway pseudopilin PulG
VLTRRGTTLAELLVAITLAAIVLATATSSLMRQQRTTGALTAQSAMVAQLRPATASVAAQLAQLSPPAGDLTPGEWRDTALQFRAPVATGINCVAAAGVVTLPPAAVDALPVGGILSLPRVGDSLWFYSDTGGGWRGRTVSEVTSVRAGCGGASTEAALRLVLAGADTVATRAPVRITRQHRLVVYRGGDGGWQLGLREWNEPTRELGPPQPLAGPFLARAPTGERTGFRFFDAAGAELRVDRDPDAATRVSRVRLTLVATRRGGSAGRPADATLRDSIDVALLPGHAP